MLSVNVVVIRKIVKEINMNRLGKKISINNINKVNL